MKIRPVRVTNPSLSEIPGLIVQPAKVVGAFAVGVGVGNLATTPLTDAIDRKFVDSGTKRGAIKLITATAVLAGIAAFTEKAKSRPKNDSAALIAAASMGAVSRLVITGIDDMTGRNEDAALEFIDAEIIDEESGSEEMQGTLLPATYFGQSEMSGASSLYNSQPAASFGSYIN